MKNIYTVLILLCLSPFLPAQTLEPTEKAALLHVVVTDFSGNAREDEVVMFRAEKNGKTVRRITDETGKFSILLPKGDTYSILYKAFLENKDYSTIEIPKDPGLMEATLEVEMEEAENQVYELDIHFETDKAIIDGNSYGVLNELVDLMQTKKKMKIEVAGHTDADGSAEHNLKLSRDRAAAVKSYLVKKGIPATRVQSLGYGESRPIESNATPAGKARNRRTEVRIVK